MATEGTRLTRSVASAANANGVNGSWRNSLLVSTSTPSSSAWRAALAQADQSWHRQAHRYAHRLSPVFAGQFAARGVSRKPSAGHEELKYMGSLSGKVIIVTGASRGIGAAAAVALAREGAAVMLTARDGATGRRGGATASTTPAAGRAAPATSRITPLSRRWSPKPKRRFGPVDALINNAGVIEPIASIADSDPAAWARNIEINLVGAYHPIRALLPRMIAAGGGTIVNVSSGAAIRPLEGWSAYCSGKAGPGDADPRDPAGEHRDTASASSASSRAPPTPTCRSRSALPASTWSARSRGRI